MTDEELRELIKAWHLRRTITKMKYSQYATSVSGQIADFIRGEEEVQELTTGWSELKMRIEALGEQG